MLNRNTIFRDDRKKTSQQNSSQNKTPKKNEQVKKLNELVDSSHQILYKCSSFFPFDLFPDYLSIEPVQVNVVKSSFFFTERQISIPIKNISDVIVQTAPFFASLTITDRFFAKNSVRLSYLKKHEAERARRIIQGLIVASREDINLGEVESEVLAKKAEQLGYMRAVE